MRVVKSLIKKWLRKKGWIVLPVNTYHESLLPVKDNWLKKMNFTSIVDVGASDGGFARKARAMFSDTPIFSFEPIKESYDRLNECFKNDKKFASYNIACSNQKGQAEFYISSNTGSSSLLEMSSLHKEAYPDSSKLFKTTVLTEKIDNILCEKETGNNVYLKMDVQGSEMFVLEGASVLLNSVSLILGEISFVTLYDCQPLVNELISYLKERGFIIAGIENVSQSLVNGSFLQADMFFIRETVVS